jgi:hypothetical protein
MDGVTEVAFDVDGQQCALSEPEGRILGERLRGFAAGQYEGDVTLLAEHGTDREWIDGARALADAIEDVLTATRPGPIPLDPTGKAADAAVAAISLPGPASWDATSGFARLHKALNSVR